MSSREHKKQAPARVKTGIISISSSRLLADDKSGHWIARAAKKERHQLVDHLVAPDDIDHIRTTVCRLINRHRPHLLILTGGTGIAAQDVTIEAMRPLFRKELAAFAVAAAQLSFEKIDSAAILSRTTAGIFSQTVVFCIPGSLDACKLICRGLIFPEAGHLAKHLAE
ncbi:MAG: molybdenum cofactor biosynthesis protein B [Desulfosudaceae bacterium]